MKIPELHAYYYPTEEAQRSYGFGDAMRCVEPGDPFSVFELSTTRFVFRNDAVHQIDATPELVKAFETERTANFGAVEHLVDATKEGIENEFQGFDHDAFCVALAEVRRTLDYCEKAVARIAKMPKPVLLVVDDDIETRTAVARMASAIGFDVAGCRGVGDVRAYFERGARAPRAVVTDWDLLDGDGADVLGEIERSRTRPRVVVHSGKRENLYRVNVQGILKGDVERLDAFLRDAVVS